MRLNLFFCIFALELSAISNQINIFTPVRIDHECVCLRINANFFDGIFFLLLQMNNCQFHEMSLNEIEGKPVHNLKSIVTTRGISSIYVLLDVIFSMHSPN